MRNAVYLASLALVLATGCVSSIEQRSTVRGGIGLSLGGGAQPDSVAHQHTPEADPVVCIMEVPGTGIAMRDIDGGLAVVFDTVSRTSVAQLRQAVRGLGTALASGQHDDHRGHHSPRALQLAAQFHAASGALPAMVTEVRDVDGGARLEVRAADPAQRELVRERMRAEIGIMQRGVCPLLGQ